MKLPPVVCLAYMAPEQLKGAGVTAKSDIYSLGLVLYELFTGKRPYEADQAIARHGMNQAGPSPRREQEALEPAVRGTSSR
jgi:serine/threonine protein kinase